MNIVIQKYGGTSVSTLAGRERVAHHVMQSVKSGYNVVVVVSAMGRIGDPYATDSLIELYKNVGCLNDYRQLDLLMSCGEIISSVVVSSTINKFGGKAIALTGEQAGILTDNNYGNANVKCIDIARIQKYLQEGVIPVVTGFQGVADNGDFTTLGRGGSDTTAALLGESLNAQKIEIYTDVDGIMSADPRLIKNAQKIDKIDYEECYQMSVDGAKVIDSKAVEVARRSNKDLIVKNTFNDGTGTTVSNLAKFVEPIVKERIITAITTKSSIVQCEVYAKADDKILIKLLQKFEDNNISLDLINFLENSQMFTVKNDDFLVVKNVLCELGLEYKARQNCCKLTVIGYKMHGVPGVMRKIVSALSSKNIKIIQSADSNTTIACLIDEIDAKNAVQVLHSEFDYLSFSGY